jgi:macrolide transport system ATP-binding/permease protein
VIRHAIRALVRSPGLAAVVIISIGIGIGVNTAVFSWLQAVMLRPLPGVTDGAAFFTVEPKADTGSFPGVSWREYHDLKGRLDAFDSLLGFRMAPMAVGQANRTERTYSLLVSGNYFPVLGLRPAAGRFLEPREVDRPGGEPVVVISHDYWQTRFAGSGSAVGQRLHVNDHDLTIVGVAPEGFQGTVMGLQFDLWVPATMAPSLLAGSRELDDRGQRGYSVMGRLREGATEAQALTEASAAMQDLARLYPQSNANLSVEIRPYWRSPRGPQQMITAALAILQGVMLLVLLAVCGNTANLVLARATSRQREVGVRLALGAGPGGVLRLLLAENLLLGLLGAAVGIVIAWWGTEALRAMPAYGALPVKFQTSVDSLGLLFAMSLGVGSGLLFGVAPAIQLARVDPLLALRAGLKSAGRSTARDGLMALQVGLALLVLIVAGLFFQGFIETRETDPGFKTDGLLLATYDLSGTAATADGCNFCVSQFATRLLARLRTVPGIDAVALASAVPLDIHGLPLRSFTLEGRPQLQEAPDQALANTVSNDYFKAMGVPIVDGRDFADMSDTTLGPQVMVNQEFVRRFVTGEVVGRRLDYRDRTYTINGVVRDSTYEVFGEAPTPAMFFAFRDRPSILAEIHLRVKPGSEVTFAGEIQRAVRELDASLPVYNVRTMTDHVDRNLMLRKIPARMFLVIAPLLLALVSMGIYAVVSYTVAHRTSEIGVRMALGATSGSVVRQIVKEGMTVIGAGALLAWMLALLVDFHLFAGGVADLPVLLGVPVLLLIVALVACWVPARRATQVDPLIALRSE